MENLTYQHTLLRILPALRRCLAAPSNFNLYKLQVQKYLVAKVEHRKPVGCGEIDDLKIFAESKIFGDQDSKAKENITAIFSMNFLRMRGIMRECC